MALIMSPLNTLFSLAIFVLSLCTATYYGVEATSRSISSSPSEDEELQLDRELKILNKPPVKTIQTEEGDIFDCIDIHKQPAFDNPKLKNHKIQLNPEFSPKKSMDEPDSSSSLDPSALIKLIPCPEGTVPIRRTSKEELRRARSFLKSYKPSIYSSLASNDDDDDGQYVAYRRSKLDYPAYYWGAQADLDIVNPRVGRDQFSANLISFEASTAQYTDTIQAGWAVAPSIFYDNRTRIFGYWSEFDITYPVSPKGCYNILCPGFVQIHGSIPLGAYVKGMSVYGGPQFRLRFTISQEPGPGNWWLFLRDEGIKIGYWPQELFELLNLNTENKTSHVAFGGLAKVSADGSSPQMGNGYFPHSGQYDKACNVQNMFVQDTGDGKNWRRPIDKGDFQDFANGSSDCYRMEYTGGIKGQKDFSFLFGGPGGRNCSRRQ